MILEFKGKKPVVHPEAFVAPTAVIIGDVTLEAGASVWYGTVIRGDSDSIRIGRNTNVQDNCTIHVDWGKPVTIGAGVTVGHGVVVHGCTIEDNCLIGINSAVLNGARIRTGSVVAAGSVVRENQEVGPNQLVAGIPAVPKREMDPETVASLKIPADIYTELAREHKDLKPA